MTEANLSTVFSVVAMLSPVFCLILVVLWIKSIRLRKTLLAGAEQKLQQALTEEKEQQSKLSSVIKHYEQRYEPILEISARS